MKIAKQFKTRAPTEQPKKVSSPFSPVQILQEEPIEEPIVIPEPELFQGKATQRGLAEKEQLEKALAGLDVDDEDLVPTYL